METKTGLANILIETHYLLRRYNMIWYGKNFGGIDPRQGQGRILTALRRMNSVSQKELGYILDIRPQSLGELLQKLESNGYIQRRHSPTDKRALIVELTKKGEAFHLQRPDYDELFIEFSLTEKRQFKKALEKISAQLTELIERETEEEFY